MTHVQADELAAIPDTDAAYRTCLIDHLEHLAAPIVTTGVALDVSRFDQSALFSAEEAERHRLFVGDDHRRAKDALILATAERERIPLVTMESKPRKLRRARRYFPAVELWSIEDFRAAIAPLRDAQLDFLD